jgi:hypothetical protein
MMEWQILLDSIDYYSYSKEDEKIHFADGENKAKAENDYKHIITTYEIDKDPEDLWAFDIALDCVRRLSYEDRAYISAHTDTSLYHFGYALEVRNSFVYRANKHFVLSADHFSSRVMQMIFAILSPEYVLE